MTHNLIKDILRLLSQPRTGCWEEDSKKSHSPACSPHHCSVTQGRRGRVEEQRLFLPTFGLAVGCTAIVDRQRAKGRGHLPGDNCHCQSPVFLSCLILVRFCRERKDKRDFSQQSWQQLALLLSPHFSSTHTWCWAPLLSAVDWQKPPPHLSTTSLVPPLVYSPASKVTETKGFLNTSLRLLLPSLYTKYNYRFCYQRQVKREKGFHNVLKSC